MGTVDIIMMRSIVILALAVSAASALELTNDNWESETAGKTVFIKFLAPW